MIENISRPYKPLDFLRGSRSRAYIQECSLSHRPGTPSDSLKGRRRDGRLALLSIAALMFVRLGNRHDAGKVPR